MEPRVREHNLPGIGRRYEMPLGSDTILVVVLHRDGRRHLAVRSAAADEAAALVDLTRDQAAAVAALLMGARFTIDEEQDR